MGERLEAVATRLKFEEVASAIRRAWQKLLGAAPSNDALAVLLAQSALETGNWKQSYCFNLGNAKATPRWGGDYCFYFADEIVSRNQAEQALLSKAPRTDGVAGHNVVVEPLPNRRAHVTLFPDHPWCRFRAFKTLDEGALDYLALLQTRFEPAWPAIESGDPEAFVRKLAELRYFTASVERYLPPVMALHAKFKARLASPEARALPDESSEEALTPAESEPTPTAPSVIPESLRASGLPAPVPERPTLRMAEPDPAVEFAQRRLLAAGYDEPGLVADGVFNQVTRECVELFQLQHVDEHGMPLVADGVIGKKTWWALMNPVGSAQRSHLSEPAVSGLTPTRARLIELLLAEYRKPVVEDPTRPNRSPDIDRYWANPMQRGLPWCCAFVSWALHQALGRYPIEEHHIGVQRMWAAAKRLGLETKEPKPGDVFVQLLSGGKGHTGFVVGVSVNRQTIFTCEGNAGNRLKLGQRPRQSIQHFIDCLRDGQGLDFPSREDLTFTDTSSDTTR